MSKNLLKRISLSSAMVLCAQPLLGIESTNPFSEEQANINRPQVDAQQQQPQSPTIAVPEHNAYPWMNTAPQNQVIYHPMQYVMTPQGPQVISQVTYQTVYTVLQPLQHNTMLQDHLAIYPGNQQYSLHQQQMPFNPLQAPGPSQGSRGMKRVREQNTVSNIHSPESQFNMVTDECPLLILSYAALDRYYEEGHTKELASVCKNWHCLINDKNLQKNCQNKIFLNGQFTYMSDQGLTIPQFLKDYENPFKIIFDLQKRAEANKWCVVTTDPSVFDEISDENKFMALIITRSFAEKNLNTTTHFLSPIMTEWNKHGNAIGYFFRMKKWSRGIFSYYIESTRSSDWEGELVVMYVRSSDAVREVEYAYEWGEGTDVLDNGDFKFIL